MQPVQRQWIFRAFLKQGTDNTKGSSPSYGTMAIPRPDKERCQADTGDLYVTF